jgi:hypothetical protein
MRAVSHRRAPGTLVPWRRWSGTGSVPVGLVTRDNAWGSAAVLQATVLCDKATTAWLTASTAGVGVVSIAGRVVANDEMYAGLFADEVSTEVGA